MSAWDDMDEEEADFDECSECGADTVMVAGFTARGTFITGWGASEGGFCADCWQEMQDAGVLDHYELEER